MAQPIARMTGAISGAPISAVPTSATTSWLSAFILRAVSVIGGGMRNVVR